MLQYKKVSLIILLLLSCFCLPVFAQAPDELDTDAVQTKRIQKLEAKVERLDNYIEQIEPAFNSFSNELDDHLKMRIDTAVGNLVYLDPLSNDFHKIDTNAGTFLVSIKEINKLEKGYLMKLRIGNPNNASYEGVKLKISWGKPWEAKSTRKTFKDWRKSLLSAEYNFAGTLEPGTWTEIAVELSPIQLGHWGHIECSMDIKTIKLQKRRR